MNDWIRLALDRSVVRRGLEYAVVVGIILVVINHGDTLLDGTLTGGQWMKIGLTMLVPYCVSVISSVGAMRDAGARSGELEETRRVLAEQTAELRENALFPEMNPGPVARLDLDGKVLRANRAAKNLFGETLIGRPWSELVPALDPESWSGIVDRQDRFWTEVEVGETVIGFTMARAPESRYVYVYGADITRLKAAERQISEMALFPEMNPGPVVRVDRAGTILLANRAARELFAGTDCLGASWLELCPGMSPALWTEILAAEEPVNHETQIADRHMLFTHTPGGALEFVFVYGADLTDLKGAERALRQSERMATLGTLAAGVAHELNNPAAAAQRAAEHLQGTFGLLQRAQLELGRLSLDEPTLARLVELDATARERATAPPDFDPVARNDREHDVELWLEDREMEDGWELAPALVALGFGPAELEALADVIPDDQVEPVVVWMSRTYPVYAVLEEIRHGTSRISDIVSALKSYAYVGEAPVQNVDVNEGIRHTLIILQNKLKQRISVDLELDESLPRIEAYGGELNQVWTNLIDNAVDAMNGEGRLTVRTRADDDWVYVDVEDDGPGIPEAIQGRVFDPFFTTKDPGQGTGLGLNTTYNTVVEKHGGGIELDSAPGRTRFLIRLPHALTREPAAAGSDGDAGQPVETEP